MNNNEKRYTAIMDMYIWAEDDAEAIAKAKHLARQIALPDDNQCNLIELSEMPFASLSSRHVYGHKVTIE